MGWRAIRLGLDRPGLLRMQIRALLRASARARAALDVPDDHHRGGVQRQPRAGRPRTPFPAPATATSCPTALKLGVMLETPSLLFELEELLAVVDFVSVGTNDLYQFAMAVGPLQRARRRSVRHAVAVVRAHAEADRRRVPDRPTSRSPCAATLPSRPLEALCLVGIGYTELSMPPAAIGPVKAAIRATDLGTVARATCGRDLNPGAEATTFGICCRALRTRHDIPV